jgi:hypothetical protein
MQLSVGEQGRGRVHSPCPFLTSPRLQVQDMTDEQIKGELRRVSSATESSEAARALRESGLLPFATLALAAGALAIVLQPVVLMLMCAGLCLPAALCTISRARKQRKSIMFIGRTSEEACANGLSSLYS